MIFRKIKGVHIPGRKEMSITNEILRLQIQNMYMYL